MNCVLDHAIMYAHCLICTFRFPRFGWLFAESSGMYPSIYIKTSMITRGVIPGQFVRSIIKEALRVRAKFSNDHMPMLPYALLRFQDNATKFYKDVSVHCSL